MCIDQGKKLTIALMIVATHESDRRPRTGYLVLKLAATVLPGGVIIKAYWSVSLIVLSWNTRVGPGGNSYP